MDGGVPSLPVRYVIAIIAMSALFGAAIMLDPARLPYLLTASIHGNPLGAYLLLSVEPFLILGLAAAIVHLVRWRIPLLLVAAAIATITHAPIEFVALLLAVAILAWPVRPAQPRIRLA